jgi:hypothetical protein
VSWRLAARQCPPPCNPARADQRLRAVMWASLHVASRSVVITKACGAVVALGGRRWALNFGPPSLGAVRLGREPNVVQNVQPHGQSIDARFGQSAGMSPAHARAV